MSKPRVAAEVDTDKELEVVLVQWMSVELGEGAEQVGFESVRHVEKSVACIERGDQVIVGGLEKRGQSVKAI